MHQRFSYEEWSLTVLKGTCVLYFVQCLDYLHSSLSFGGGGDGSRMSGRMERRERIECWHLMNPYEKHIRMHCIFVATFSYVFYFFISILRISCMSTVFMSCSLSSFEVFMCSALLSLSSNFMVSIIIITHMLFYVHVLRLIAWCGMTTLKPHL